jgi:anti-anti-sigma factor
MAVVEESGLRAEIVEDRPAGGDSLRRRVSLAGEIDMATAPTLRTALDAAFTERCTVIVDMSGVNLMGSSGLAELLHARNRLRAVDGTLFVTNTAPNVRRVLEICGLAELLSERGGTT